MMGHHGGMWLVHIVHWLKSINSARSKDGPVAASFQFAVHWSSLAGKPDAVAQVESLG
jgi:hypothetical protein